MTYTASEKLLYELAVAAKEARKKKGLTQIQLAEKAGVPVDVIRRIEQAREVYSGALLRVLDRLELHITANDSGMRLARIRQVLNE